MIGSNGYFLILGGQLATPDCRYCKMDISDSYKHQKVYLCKHCRMPFCSDACIRWHMLSMDCSVVWSDERARLGGV